MHLTVKGPCKLHISRSNVHPFVGRRFRSPRGCIAFVQFEIGIQFNGLALKIIGFCKLGKAIKISFVFEYIFVFIFIIPTGIELFGNAVQGQRAGRKRFQNGGAPVDSDPVVFKIQRGPLISAHSLDGIPVKYGRLTDQRPHFDRADGFCKRVGTCEHACHCERGFRSYITHHGSRDVVAGKLTGKQTVVHLNFRLIGLTDESSQLIATVIQVA